ncbi:retrovirus-related pol polyprotein from transposon TNT 1-94 [Tanacetum coccineum]
MPLSTYLNLVLGELAHTKLTVELADRTVKHPKGIAENVLVGIGKFVFPVDFIILDIPEDVNVPLILERPFLSTAHAKVDVFKRKITLRVGDEKIIFKSIKPASSLIKRVYMLGLRERMDLDLEARLIGETLILIVEDMDPYLDEGMGDVIVGKPFYKASCMKAKRFNGIITIRDGDDSVTYQMGDGVVVRGDDDGGGGCSDEVMMLARCGGLDGGDEPAVMAPVVRGGAVAIWWQPWGAAVAGRWRWCRSMMGFRLGWRGWPEKSAGEWWRRQKSCRKLMGEGRVYV